MVEDMDLRWSEGKKNIVGSHKVSLLESTFLSNVTGAIQIGRWCDEMCPLCQNIGVCSLVLLEHWQVSKPEKGMDSE